MNAVTMIGRKWSGVLVVWLLLIASWAPAQTLSGLWGSALYRVELSVSGTNISGTFASLDDPKAPPGKIAGQMQSGGRTFTAQWNRPVGPDSGSFQTLLTLSRDGLVLVGYVWIEETEPTSFALHRAVNGELVQLLDADGVTVGGASGQQQTPATTGVGAGPVGTGAEMRPPVATSTVFPASPFNLMQITYSVAGAALGDPTDTSGFTTGRTLKGHITGNALTVSGTVRVGGFGAAVTVSVWAGDKKKDERFQVSNEDGSGNPTDFSVTIPVAPGAQTGGFTVDMDGQYGSGHRGLFVKGEFLPAIPPTGSVTRDACLANLGAVARAMLFYAQDHDDRLPDATRWMDEIKAYLQDEGCLRCPAAPQLPYGYAMNQALSQVVLSAIAEPYDTVLLFESNLGTRNAAGKPEAAAQPPRHAGVNHVAFAEGYCKAR